LNKHRDVHVGVPPVILKLKGMCVLCSNLRDVCAAMRTRGRYRLALLYMRKMSTFLIYIRKE